MTTRLLALSLFVCALMCTFAIAQSSEAPYPPFRPGTIPPLVQMGSGAASEMVPPAGATWTKAKTAPPVSVGAMLLLTDGRVLVHSEPNCNGCVGNYNNWYTLTPNNAGSYINGAWKQVASLPNGYDPLFFGSAVLPDGKVVVQGGEYNCPGSSCTPEWQSLGAIYDPGANKWTATTPPATSRIGDAESVVLPNGTWMLAECCAVGFGHSTFPVYYTFNESTRSFTKKSSATDGKHDEFDEEGWNLLASGKVLTVDANTSNTAPKGTN